MIQRDVPDHIYDDIKNLMNVDTEELVEFTSDLKQNAPIRISFRAKKEAGESHSFQELFTRDLLEFFDNRYNLTDRILRDLHPNKKSSRKSTFSLQHILDSLSIDIATVNVRPEIADEVKQKPIVKVHEEELITLLLDVVFVWNSLPGGLRASRRFNQKHVKGYLKMRKDWEHDEIISALQVYGKWADAYARAMKAGEHERIFWFHRWSLDKFLVSNTAMDHVSVEWSELVKDKGIPEQYSKSSVDWLSEFDRKNQLSRERNERIRAEQKAAINE